MDVTVADLINALESWAPSKLAEDWDNVGLQVGSLEQRVEKLAVCLDLTPNTLAQAIEKEIDGLVTHHPFIFSPLKRISFDSWQGKLLRELIKRDIFLISAHTNLDAAREGVTEIFARALKLELEGALAPSPGSRLFRVTVYVPKGYEEKVRRFLVGTEAAVRGRYKGATFSVEGQGSFYPLPGAKPAVGETGKLNLVQESKIEFLAPAFSLPKLIKGLKELHPYEEVPIDIWPVEERDQRFGLGRVGTLPLEYTLQELAQKVGEVLNTKAVFMVGEPQRLVRRVALCAGAGGDLFRRALELKVDVYLTAEVKYHLAREAEALGLPLITFGHFESERLIVPQMARFFEEWARGRGCSLEVSVLEESSPFQAAF